MIATGSDSSSLAVPRATAVTACGIPSNTTWPAPVKTIVGTAVPRIVTMAPRPVTVTYREL